MTQHKLDKAKEKTNRRTTTTNNNAQSASSKHEKKLTSENQKLLKQIAKLKKKIANFTSMEKQLARRQKRQTLATFGVQTNIKSIPLTFKHRSVRSSNLELPLYTKGKVNRIDLIVVRTPKFPKFWRQQCESPNK